MSTINNSSAPPQTKVLWIAIALLVCVGFLRSELSIEVKRSTPRGWSSLRFASI